MTEYLETYAILCNELLKAIDAGDWERVQMIDRQFDSLKDYSKGGQNDD